eukprot:1156772-Pelagomonas_calceolata.AAC.6
MSALWEHGCSEPCFEPGIANSRQALPQHMLSAAMPGLWEQPAGPLAAPALGCQARPAGAGELRYAHAHMYARTRTEQPFVV